MMKIFKIKKKGFSLIELLIVIAIIGILSTIVLNSLSTSRSKAYDAKVKQQLSSFRTAAEMYFGNKGRYNITAGVPISDCTTNPSLFTDFGPENGAPGLYITSGSLPDFANPVCDSSDTAYSVKATLYSGTDYWCVDNKGFSGLFPGGTPISSTSCP